MIGVAFSTAALIVVLSVFNGLEDLLRSLYTSFDPEIKIELARGKSFEVKEPLLNQIKAIEGVTIVTEVIEDYAYVRYRDADMVVTIKGVSNNFLDQHRLDDHITDGELKLHKDSVNFAIIGRGIQYALSISVQENFFPLQVFYIKKLKGASFDPTSLYSRKLIQPGGVFSIEKNYDDNFIFLPLEFTQELLDYGNKRTSLEVKTDEGVDLFQVQNQLKKLLGENFNVMTNEEQHKDLYRLLKVEKLFTFLALVLLILVASINIFFSLMMLVIEKKKDMPFSRLSGQPKH
jgi:ABC-type transport system, involved in lipoprotein release, permease component